jgi:predicted dehydrogenase
VTRPPDPQVERLRAESEASITAAIGDVEPALRRIYQAVLLDTLVHELNAVRGLLGEPDRLDYVDLRETTVTVMLRFGALPVAIHWIDLPGIARYEMDFALYAPDRRISLSFPSPFLRGAPTVIAIEGGDPGSARSSASQEITSYESSFKRELIAFHDGIVNGAPVATPGSDARRDIALCEAIIESAQSGRPIDHPTRTA